MHPGRGSTFRRGMTRRTVLSGISARNGSFMKKLAGMRRGDFAGRNEAPAMTGINEQRQATDYQAGKRLNDDRSFGPESAGRLAWWNGTATASIGSGTRLAWSSELCQTGATIASFGFATLDF